MNNVSTAPSLRHWALPAAIVVLASCFQALGWTEALRFERDLNALQPWRLVTAHLVHLGWAHLFMNVAALVLLWAWLGPVLPLRFWAASLAGSAASASAGLALLSPSVGWYAGLSGVLHGLLGSFAVAGLRRSRIAAVAVGLLLGTKLAVELFFGADTPARHLAGGAVIVEAHLYGTVGGIAIGAVALWRAGRRP